MTSLRNTFEIDTFVPCAIKNLFLMDYQMTVRPEVTEKNQGDLVKEIQGWLKESCLIHMMKEYQSQNPSTSAIAKERIKTFLGKGDIDGMTKA